MQPNIILNWPAIIVSVLAAFVFGFLWFGPLFGKVWGKAMGMNMDRKPKKKEMYRGMGLQVLGLFLMAFILAHTLQVWRPSAWGVGQDMADAVYGLNNGFWIWLGFFIPQQLSKVAWENRSWKVFAINVGHDFLILQIMSQILAHWK